MKDNNYIYGKNAVLEALKLQENQSESEIQKVFICYGSDNSRIQILAKRNKIPCVTFDKRKFKELEIKSCPKDAKTQGVVALKQIIQTSDLLDFLAEIDISKNPIIAILDRISDPQNLGAIARSAECSGIAALILPTNNSVTITPAAIKASAGALNYIPVIQVQNLINAIEKLKEAGFWIVGTDMKGKDNYFAEIYNKPTAVIIGSEGKGISPSLQKHCDNIVRINMQGKINSLNASVTAGIMFFEIQRQRILSQNNISNE